jgi:hypothetical protein
VPRVRRFELLQRESGLWVILLRTGSKADVVETGHLDRNLAALDRDSFASSRTLSPIGQGWLRVADRLSGNMRTQRNKPHRGSETHEILNRTDILRLLMEQGYRCPVSGSYFSHDSFDGDKRDPFQPSVDRRDASLGYTRSNIRLVCLLVNMAMSDWGEAPLLKIARRIVALEDSARITPDNEHPTNETYASSAP